MADGVTRPRGTADDLEAAKNLGGRALAILSLPGNRPQTWGKLIDAATVLMVRRGDLERAAALVGAADAINNRSTGPVFTPFRSLRAYSSARTALDQGLGQAAFERAHAAGAAVAPEDVNQLVEEALG